MPIPVVCSCSAKLKVGDHLKGKHIKCPKCGALVPVGVANGTPAAPAPAKAPPTTKEVLEHSPLSEAERDTLEGELDKDERLVWAGRPDPRAAFLRGIVYTVALGVVAFILLVIVIIMMSVVGFKDTGGTVVFVLIGLLGLAAAGGAAAAPYAHRWRMGKVFYAFTTKRALVWGCTWAGKTFLNVYGPSDMAQLSLQGGGGDADAVGSVIFGVRVKTTQTRQGTVRTAYGYGFFLVPRAAEVEKLLRETLLNPYLDKLYE